MGTRRKKGWAQDRLQLEGQRWAEGQDNDATYFSVQNQQQQTTFGPRFELSQGCTSAARASVSARVGHAGGAAPALALGCAEGPPGSAEPRALQPLPSEGTGAPRRGCTPGSSLAPDPAVVVC